MVARGRCRRLFAPIEAKQGQRHWQQLYTGLGTTRWRRVVERKSTDFGCFACSGTSLFDLTDVFQGKPGY